MEIGTTLAADIFHFFHIFVQQPATKTIGNGVNFIIQICAKYNPIQSMDHSLTILNSESTLRLCAGYRPVHIITSHLLPGT